MAKKSALASKQNRNDRRLQRQPRKRPHAIKHPLTIFLITFDEVFFYNFYRLRSVVCKCRRNLFRLVVINRWYLHLNERLVITAGVYFSRNYVDCTNTCTTTITSLYSLSHELFGINEGFTHYLHFFMSTLNLHYK